MRNSIASPPVPSDWQHTTFTVTTTTTPPRIDGRIDDECWTKATHAEGFYRYASTAPVQDQTEAWLCADSANLYIAFHCLDTQPDKIQANETQRNGGAFKDDFVGVEIDSQNTRRAMSRFIVTPRGTQWESIDGGSADNIKWRGDWKAAGQRTATGWDAEVAIPFTMLRYPNRATSFNMLLFRKLVRETYFTCWPYLPPTINDATVVLNLPRFDGLALPLQVSRPVFLPYILGTAGDTNALRGGLDVKYPLSTTMTGLLTVSPDFQTVEQSVTDINFSYTEKFLDDRRPFFVEGSGFLPDSDVFYSRRIGEFDAGLKVAGKTGPTALGVIGTTKTGGDGQSTFVFNDRQEFGKYSQFAVSGAANNQNGQPANRVMKVAGTYGWQSSLDRWYVYAQDVQSWVDEKTAGGKEFAGITYKSRPGHPNIALNFQDIAPDLVSTLGFVPELDIRGQSLFVEQGNSFPTGGIESYYGSATISSYQHHTGGFYRGERTFYAAVNTRSGNQVSFRTSQSPRRAAPGLQFDDHVDTYGLGWNLKSLFQGGIASYNTGRVFNMDYRFVTLQQGVLVAPRFSVQANWSRLDLGDSRQEQTIVTGTYRANPTDTFGGRLVQQDDKTNIYLSFGRRTPAGTDLFVLIGDPNASKTRTLFTVKLARAL